MTELGKSWAGNERKAGSFSIPGQFHVWECQADFSQLMSFLSGPGYIGCSPLLYFLAFLKVLSFFSLRLFTTKEDFLKKSSGWCGSVGWVSSHKPKGHQFNSWSGHLPGLWARSPIGAHARGRQSMCLSLSFSLCSPLSKDTFKK